LRAACLSMIGHNAPLLMSFLEQNAHASLSSLLL